MLAATGALVGDVDGDVDFDANDSFLIHLAKLSGTDAQIDDSKGSSALSAAQIRSNIDQIGLGGDVDGDGDFDANDSFLIHLTNLSGSDSQINQTKGSSSRSASQIRSVVDGMADVVRVPLVREAPTGTINTTFASFDVVFDEAMGPSAFDVENYSLVIVGGSDDGQTVPITSTTKADDVTATVGLVGNLADESYRLTLDDTVIADATGDLLTGFTTFDFTVFNVTAIASVSPAYGKTGVRPSRNVYIDLDQPIDPTTVTAQSVQLSAAGEPLNGTRRVSVEGTRITLTLDQPLPGATAVRLIVDGDVIRTAADGKPLDGNDDGTPGGQHKSEFRTATLTPIPGTSVSGFIYDATRSTDSVKVPIVGLTLRVDGLPGVTAVTDANGHFELQDVPAPEFFVNLDTSTVTNVPAGFFYAGPEKPFHSIAGQTTSLNHGGVPFDIYLPLVKSDETTAISAGEMTVATFGESALDHLAEIMPGVPREEWEQNFKVEIPPDSLFFEDGTPASEVRVFALDKSRIPAPLPEGLDSNFVFSIQAGGAKQFDAPSRITFPNVDGLAPGETRPLFSFDHDAGEWVLTGQATVSEDGSVLETDEGGVNTLGWKILGINLTNLWNGTWRVLGDSQLFFLTFETVLSAADFFNSSFRVTAPIAAGLVGAFGGGAACGPAAPACAVGAFAASFAAAEVAANKVSIKTDLLIANARALNQTIANGGTPTELQINALGNSAVNTTEVLISKVAESRGPATSYGNAIRNHIDIAKDLGQDLGNVVNYVNGQNNGGRSQRRGARSGGFTGSEIHELLNNEFGWDELTEEERVLIDDVYEHYVANQEDLPQSFQMMGKLGHALWRLEKLVGMNAPSAAELQEMQEATTDLLDNIAVLTDSRNVVDRDAAEATKTLNQLLLQVDEIESAIPATSETLVLYEYNGFEIRDVTVDGKFSHHFPADTFVTITLFNPESGHVGTGALFTNSDANATSDISASGMLFESHDDGDNDGLVDLAEKVLGSNPEVADSNGNGILDGVEFNGGLNREGLSSFPTGIIASLTLPGESVAILIHSDAANPTQQTAYIATGTHGLAIVDASQFNQPILLGQLELPGTTTAVAFNDQANLAFVAAGDAGLHVVDVSDPLAPALVRTDTGFSPTRLELLEGVLFAAGDVLAAVDAFSGELLLLNPIASERVTDVHASAGLLYVITDNDRLHTVDPVAAAGGGSPVVDSIEIPIPPVRFLQPADMRVFVANDVAYVANGLEVFFVAETRPLERGGYITFDVSDPADLSLISNIDTGDFQAGNLQTVLNGSGLALVAGGFQGLVVYDASEPTDTFEPLIEVATPGTATSVAVASGIAWVADADGGLHVINYLPFDANGIAPTASITTDIVDIDPVAAGLQLTEGRSFTVFTQITDDVQVRNAELLIDGQVVGNDVSFPFELASAAPLLAEGEVNRDLTVHVRATDTGGNATVSAPILISVVPDTIAPTVQQVTPVNGSLRSTGPLTVRVTFSESMDVSTFTNNSIRLVADSSGQVLTPTDLQTRLNDRQLLVSFDALPAGDLTLTADGSLLADRAGNLLGTDFVSTFTAIAITDPGSTLGTATDLGVLNRPVQISESIGIPDAGNTPDPIDVYRFTVDDFVEISVDVTGRTDGARVFLVSDLNNDGAFNVGEDLRQLGASGTSNLGFKEGLVPGEYFLWIEPFADTDQSEYTLRLDSTPLARMELNSGETVLDAISRPDEVDVFTFDAHAGDKLFLTFGEVVSSAFFNPGVFIYAPDNSLVDSHEFNHTGTSFSDLTLPASGRYTIVIRDTDADLGGDYSLTAVVVDETVDADDVLLTSGQTVAGTLALGDIDTFTIDAAAGETLFVTFGEIVSNTSFNPGVFIYAPDNSLVDSQDFDSSSISFTNLSLAMSGRYTIVVRDADADRSGDYSLTAVVVNATIDADDVALVSGQTIAGTLLSGDIDTFTINATAGETLFVTFGETVSDTNFNPGVFIYAPNGTLIGSIDSTSSGETFSNLELLVMGTYTIVIRDRDGDVTGDYSLTAVVVDETIDADNVALTSGQTVAGTLASGDIDIFTIDATAGETLFVTFGEIVSNTNFNPGVFIYAPDGTLVGSVDSTSSGTTFSELAVVVTGTYTIVVRDRDGDFTGNYSLTALVVNETIDADNVTLTSGQTEAGTLELGDVDTFTIDAAAGETLFVTFGEIVSNTNFNPGVFIYAPDGTLVISVDSTSSGTTFSDLALVVTGTYTIVVRDRDGDFTGAYSLTAVVVDDAVDTDNVALTSSTPVNDTLALGDIDTFTIDAVAGQTLSVTFAESVSNTSFNPGIFIYASDGTRVTSVDSTSSGATFSDLALSATGTYVIVVRDKDGDHTGDFSLIATVT